MNFAKAATLAQLLSDSENQPHQYVGRKLALLHEFGALHYHVNNQKDDHCAECGLDMFDVIHKRSLHGDGER